MHPPARALGLPVASARGVWVVTGLVLLVYLFTQYRDLSVWDSALIALVAQQGGVGHPPGYPLHTWLGFLLARLPGVPPPLAIGWLSAIPGALLCVPVASLAWQFGPPQPHGGPSSLNAGSCRHAPTLALGAVIAAMALHPAWWDPATRIEVYSLAAFLAVWALARLASSLDLRAPGTSPGRPAGAAAGGSGLRAGGGGAPGGRDAGGGGGITLAGRRAQAPPAVPAGAGAGGSPARWPG